MNMYKTEIINTLEQETRELRRKIKYFKERADHNHMEMRRCESQLSEAISVLKQLKEVKY